MKFNPAKGLQPGDIYTLDFETSVPIVFFVVCCKQPYRDKYVLTLQTRHVNRQLLTMLGRGNHAHDGIDEILDDVALLARCE